MSGAEGLLDTLWRVADRQALLLGAAATRLGIPVSGMTALMHLVLEGSMPARQLADAVGITPSALTTVVDKLIHRGLVSRAPTEHDRRVKLVSATPSGVEAVHRQRARLADVLGHRVDALWPVQRSLDEISAAVGDEARRLGRS